MQPSRRFAFCLASALCWPAMAQFGGYRQVDGCHVRQVLPCDIDGDHAPDLLVTKDDGLFWYRNLDGLGGFGPQQPILGHPPQVRLLVRAADADGDGDLDLVAARDDDSTLYLFTNLDGLGGFAMPQAIATLPARMQPGGFTSLALADLTGDGLPEVLALYGGHNTVFRCTNTGGAFAPIDTLPDLLPGPSSGLFSVGDLDADGDADLLLSDMAGHYVAVLNSTGDGTTWTAEALFTALPGVGREADLLDIDGDGDLDIGMHGPVLQWARNEGAWPAYTVLSFSTGLDAGRSAYGRVGCGARASTVNFPADGGTPTRWRQVDDALADFGPALDLPDVLKGERIRCTDLDGDGRDDLLVTYANAFGWYRSELPAAGPGWSLAMPALDTLCWYGGAYDLPAPQPVPGTWSGPMVHQGQFQSFMAPPGTYPLRCLAIDTGGCPVAGAARLQVVSGPVVRPSVAPVPRCPDGPLELTASPSTGIWFGPVDSTGMVDLAHRPILGEAIFVLLDAAGGSCASEGLWLDLPAPAPLSLMVDTLMCSNEPPQTLVLSGPSPGAVTLTGAVSGVQYAQPHILAAQFDPGQGAGIYALVATADGGAFCPDTLTTWIIVNPEPVVALTPFDTLCSSSGPYPLHHAQPTGGLWSGFGVLGGHFDVATHQFGSYPLSYAYTDANGCSTTAVQTITTVRRPFVTGPPDGSVLCADEGVQQYHATPSGGLWSAPLNAATGTLDPTFIAPLPFTGAAVYNFTDATGGQCSNLPRTFTVQARTVPQVLAGGPYCDNGTPADVPGSPPGTWGGAATGSGPTGLFDPASAGAGTHAVTLTAAWPDECAGTATAQVLVLHAPMATLHLPVDTIGLYAAPWPLSGGAPAGGAFMVGGQVVTTFDPQALGPGWTVVTYTVMDGPCKGEATDSVFVRQDTGAEGPSAAPALHLLPNPATDHALVDGPPQAVRVRLTDAAGRAVRGEGAGMLPLSLDLRGLAPGRYTVQVLRGARADMLPLVVLPR